MYKHFIINTPIFPYDVAVFFGDKDKMLKKMDTFVLSKGEHKWIKKMNWDVRGRAIKFKTNCLLLWCKDIPDSHEALSVLNHEIYHTVCYMMGISGVKYGQKSEEVFAYLIEFLSKECYFNLKLKIKV